MPIDRARMIETPVDRNPARPPGFESNVFRSGGVAADIEYVEIVPSENGPVAFQKGAAQMFGQRFQRAPVGRIVGVNRVVIEPSTNEIVVARVVQIGAIESGGRFVIHPQMLSPTRGRYCLGWSRRPCRGGFPSRDSDCAR